MMGRNIDELAKKYGIEKPTPPTQEEIEAFDKWFERYKEAEKRGWVARTSGRPDINHPDDLYEDALQSWKYHVDRTHLEELVALKAEAKLLIAKRRNRARAIADEAYRKAMAELEAGEIE